ncbi:hypothetical protein PG987_013464 [Apiospora arundinis]
MDRQLQRGREQQAEPNPPVAAGGSEKRARSLTRRPRIGVGVGVGAGGSSKRSTTPTPQRLSFSRPSAAATAAIPSSSSSSSSSSPPRNISSSSGGGGGASAGSAAKFSYGKPLTDLPSAPPNAPLPRPPTDKKKSSTVANSSNSNSRSNSSNSSNNGGNTTISAKDWLADTETQLRQDLETTKKELELIRTILWEIEMDDSSSSPPAPSSPSSSSGIGSPPPPVQPVTTSSSPPGTTGAAGSQQQKSQRKMLMAACREYAESRRQLLRERLRQVQFWAGSRAMGRRVPSTAPLDWGLADAEWAKWLGDQAAAAMQQRQQQSQQQKKDSWMMIEGEAGAAWGPLPHIIAGFTFSLEGGIGRGRREGNRGYRPKGEGEGGGKLLHPYSLLGCLV